MTRWWDTRGAAVAFVLLAMVPLAWPAVPPLVDLPGHMGRWRVQLDQGVPSPVHAFYGFEWQLIGNLGLDLLIEPFGRLFGLEAGTKALVIAIPALTVAGLLWIAREVHGRVPPTALFALPLAYALPFLFGFANFALAMALALNAFALWLRLGPTRLRAAVFVPISVAIWVAHAFGWGLLGLLAFAAELDRERTRQGSWLRAVLPAIGHCLILALPALLMLVWRSGAAAGETKGWFDWGGKLSWLAMVFRDRWETFDLLSVLVLAGVVAFAAISPRFSFARPLAVAAGLLAAAFVVMPTYVFGSAYADLRLAPYLLAIALVAIAPPTGVSERLQNVVSKAGLGFLLVRTFATTASLGAVEWNRNIALLPLDALPQGARLVSFVASPCEPGWALDRNWHLPAMALVRRRAYSNDQWVLPGAQLLTIRKADAGAFAGDPSQVVTAGPCPGRRTLDRSLAHFPRAAFDYVWIVGITLTPAQASGLTSLAGSDISRLYRIDRAPMVAQP